MTPSDTDIHRNIGRPRTWLGVALAAGLVLASACTSAADPNGQFRAAGELALVSFDSCEAAADGLRKAALAKLDAQGMDAVRGPVAADGADAGDDAARLAAPEAGAAAEQPAMAPGRAPGDRAAHSGTNVHEAGVDEPDLVKTDGRRIVTLTDGVLRVIDAEQRVETGSLSLSDHETNARGWYGADLLLHRDRALVLLRQGGRMPIDLPEPARDRPGQGGVAPASPGGTDVAPEPIAGPRLALVDLTGTPQLVSEFSVDGRLVDARAVEGTARVVVRSSPRLDQPPPDQPSPDQPSLDRQSQESGRDAEQAWRDAYRERLKSADVSEWLPRYQVTTAGSTSSGRVDCTAVRHPAEFSGTSMLTVLTFDLAAAELDDGDPVSVVADGDTVYSNGTSLYVSNDQQWRGLAEPDDAARPDAQRTEIYKFDVSQPGPPRYVASGEVDGWLLNQYAMSEWDGHLRVATTTGDVWAGPEGEPDSESAVHVLTQRGDALVKTGSVGGLGKGERIYAVRYAGPVGHVVTFRETDPLYTLDLRDPSAPAVLGELKITGYSAYLHPLDDGRVLGVGQEADTSGRVQGTQVSLFDVSDLSNPRVLDQHHVPWGNSEAEHDPHAFLWWPREQLAVMPLTGGDGPQQGALVLGVDGDELVERDVVTHPSGDGWDGASQIRRALVIGDTLWTVSTRGLQANELSTMDTVVWLPF